MSQLVSTLGPKAKTSAKYVLVETGSVAPGPPVAIIATVALKHSRFQERGSQT